MNSDKTSKKKGFQQVLMLFTIMALLGMPGRAAAEHSAGPKVYTGPDPNVTSAAVTLGDKTLLAVVANTDSSRAKGLLGWDRVTEGAGMLLDFGTEGQHAVHMQGMKFPIDAVWIDSKGVIRLIYQEILPNSGLIYPSMFPCRYCLEIKAGLCEKYGIKMGQTVKLGVPEPPPR